MSPYDHHGFATLLLSLHPLLVPLWLWAAARALRELARPTATGPAIARCGLPDRPLGPPPGAALLRRAAPRKRVAALPAG